MAGTEAKQERERIAAARRASKPRVTQAHVDSLMAVMTPEGRAAVALQAVHRLRVAPSLPWLKW
jgi:hypothetical protein